MITPDVSFSYHCDRNNIFQKNKNIWEPVIENVIISGFLMTDTSSKQQKVYIFGEICHFLLFMLYIFAFKLWLMQAHG